MISDPSFGALYDSRSFGPSSTSTSTSTSKPPPNWSLTEPLCKPLHHFSDEELEGLVSELRASGYDHRERAIQAAVDEIVLLVSRSQPGYDPYTMLPSNRLSFDVPWSDRPGHHRRLRVVLPGWLPAEYIKPFAERMIRDQLEEE